MNEVSVLTKLLTLVLGVYLFYQYYLYTHSPYIKPRTAVFYTQKDKRVDFENLKGKSVVLVFWGSQCDDCDDTIREVNYLKDDNPNILVLGYHTDALSESALKFTTRRNRAYFDHILDTPEYLLNMKKPKTIPSFFIFSPDGRLKAKLMGFQRKEEIEAIVAKPNEPQSFKEWLSET